MCIEHVLPASSPPPTTTFVPFRHPTSGSGIPKEDPHYQHYQHKHHQLRQEEKEEREEKEREVEMEGERTSSPLTSIGGRQSRGSSGGGGGATSPLISPSHRKRLLDEAARTFKYQRSLSISSSDSATLGDQDQDFPPSPSPSSSPSSTTHKLQRPPSPTPSPPHPPPSQSPAHPSPHPPSPLLRSSSSGDATHGQFVVLLRSKTPPSYCSPSPSSPSSSQMENGYSTAANIRYTPFLYLSLSPSLL